MKNIKEDLSNEFNSSTSCIEKIYYRKHIILSKLFQKCNGILIKFQIEFLWPGLINFKLNIRENKYQRNAKVL